jgi:tetratricopeptide (TPR) repeat protein
MLRHAAALLLLLPLAACEHRPVVRLVDGVPVAHRPISIRAYAAYARGAVAEATGALNVALLEYRVATDADSRGVEPWVRTGAVSCALGSVDAADSTFAQAEERDADYEPLWTERARCQLAHGDAKLAVALSERAEGLDPESDDAIRMHAEALDKSGDSAAALRELTALAVIRPTPATFRAQLDIAKRVGDTATVRAAERALGARGVPVDSVSDQSAVDRAIAAGDVDEAVRLARRLGQNPTDVAVRAAALGQYDVARKIADPIVKADPHDGDALIASAASRDPKDPHALDDLLALARPRSESRLSRLGKLVLLETLYRHVGPEALEGATFATDAGSGDDVERALLARLRAAQSQQTASR